MLRSAGPWGQGFPEPVFDGAFQIVDARIVGGKHLKLQLREQRRGRGAAGPRCDCLRLRGRDARRSLDPAGREVRLAYRLELNEYNGMERVQLNCQHLQPRSLSE